MQPTTRKAAIAAGLNKYYTGEACRNGHIAERYTTSGTCAGCLAESPGRRYNAEIRDSQDERRNAFNQLETILLRAQPGDIAYLRSLAGALLILRFPGVLDAESASDRKGGTNGEGGALLYKVRCHPDDRTALKAEENRLLNLHGPDVAAIRNHAFERLQKIAPAEVCPVPEFRP